MDSREEIEANDTLGRLLAEEARRTRPEFSEALHARLCAAVRAAPLPEPLLPVGRPAGTGGGILSWAVAAAASIAVFIGLAWLCHKPGPPVAVEIAREREIPVEPPLPAVGEFEATAGIVSAAASGIEDWVQTAASESQWAGLDRDAKTVLATVAGPLPFDLSLALAANSRD